MSNFLIYCEIIWDDKYRKRQLWYMFVFGVRIRRALHCAGRKIKKRASCCNCVKQINTTTSRLNALPSIVVCMYWMLSGGTKVYCVVCAHCVCLGVLVRSLPSIRRRRFGVEHFCVNLNSCIRDLQIESYTNSPNSHTTHIHTQLGAPSIVAYLQPNRKQPTGASGTSRDSCRGEYSRGGRGLMRWD